MAVVVQVATEGERLSAWVVAVGIGESAFNGFAGKSAGAAEGCFRDEFESLSGLVGAQYHNGSRAELLSLKLSDSKSDPVEASGISCKVRTPVAIR